MNRKQIGQLGENLAIEFLIAQGHKIIETNFYSKWGEIDIISKFANKYVFTEVKTRSSTTYGLAEEAILPNKIKRLLKTIYQYNFTYLKRNIDWRIDAIAIQLNVDRSLAQIKHFKNIC